MIIKFLRMSLDFHCIIDLLGTDLLIFFQGPFFFPLSLSLSLSLSLCVGEWVGVRVCV